MGVEGVRVKPITVSRVAFSSEVDAGSREENASKQELGSGSDPIRTRLQRRK
jgi:hypothetical protein